MAMLIPLQHEYSYLQHLLAAQETHAERLFQRQQATSMHIATMLQSSIHDKKSVKYLSFISRRLEECDRQIAVLRDRLYHLNAQVLNQTWLTPATWPGNIQAGPYLPNAYSPQAIMPPCWHGQRIDNSVTMRVSGCIPEVSEVTQFGLVCGLVRDDRSLRVNDQNDMQPEIYHGAVQQDEMSQASAEVDAQHQATARRHSIS